ncbi:MAG TPA: hypothetical protein VJ768_10290 [Anaerolineales bacterium]|nr:hypothetical protein [Anaerolineales bacterium]
MAAGIPVQQIVVDVLTPSYRLVGKIQVTHTGVIGLINDKTTSVLKMQEASMARLDTPTKLADRFRVIRVVKDRIFALCLARREDLGSQAWSRGGYGYQYDYPVRIISPIFEMDGVLEWSERFDLHAFMVEGTREFLPLYDADVRTVTLKTFRMESPAVLFNRTHVDALALHQGSTGELSTGELRVD